MTGGLPPCFLLFLAKGRRRKIGLRYLCVLWGPGYSFLLISCLGALLASTDANPCHELQTAVTYLKGMINNSDAMLYAPEIQEIQVPGCSCVFIRCYLLELQVILLEVESQVETYADMVNTTLEFMTCPNTNSGCPACEAQAVTDAATFLMRIEDLLNYCSLNNIKDL